MRDHVGQQLGSYQLIQLLGQGSWASVYLGEHLHLHTRAALKVPFGPWADSEVESFFSEASMLARLRHPHIVRVLDFGVQEGTPFLVMEYAPEGTLRQLHPRGERLPLQTIVSYVKQVAEALQYIHDRRLIHRDLKPENLLLGPEQQVWLSDFGLALVAHSARGQSLQQTAGTLAYMAPEQFAGRPLSASDQYALGVLVYEWLAGERPFSGPLAELAYKQTLAPPPALSEKVPTLPAGVERVVLQALAKDPQLRFSSVQAFALALEEACAQDASWQTLVVPTSNLPAVSSPLKLLGSRLHNLPVQPTPLIGREQVVAAVRRLLLTEGVRLVTLTGPGGVGKTRMALQVVAACADSFADGVFFVNLAAVSDPALVIPTIAQTLGIQEVAGQPLQERLKEYLQQQQVLLLLDNFEQVTGGAMQVADLLAACQKLKVLVTSRAVLHLRAEHEFAVLPLALPDPARLPDLAALQHYAAVALFLERAQATKSDFQLTAANARAVAEICVHLDGLPLAIELAAARIKLLPPQALLSRLSARLSVLTGVSRDVPARQQTLRTTIAWSYQLLDAAEQRLFRSLAVFSGGCTLSAAEAVCGTGSDAGEVLSVLDCAASLIDKSLLQQIEQEREEPRLVMLETIREYAWEVLATSAGAEATQRAHAAYYLALAEEAEPGLIGAERGRWLECLQQDKENLRAALAWLVQHHEQEAALRLGGALWRFWWMRGHLSEGRTRLARALAESRGEVATPVRAKALCAAGALAGVQGDFEQAVALCGQSRALFQALLDRRGGATALSMLGYVALQRSDYTEARSLLEEAVTLYREVDDQDGIAWVLVNLAGVFHFQGEYERARIVLEEAVALSRAGGDSWSTANALWILALVITFQGDLTRARALLEESLVLSRRESYKGGIASSLFVSGMIHLQSDVAKARPLLEESLALFKDLGDRQSVAQALGGLAWISFVQDEYARARALLLESFAVARAVGSKWYIAACLTGLGAVVAAQGAWAWAVRLLSAGQAQCEATHSVLPPFVRTSQERATAAARDQLGEEVFTVVWAEARTMTPEQVLAAQGPATSPPPATPARPSSALHALKAPAFPDGLTAREVEVLRLVAQGLTDAEVAGRLIISPRTVNTHLKSIYGKIQVKSRSAATRYAIEHQIL